MTTSSDPIADMSGQIRTIQIIATALTLGPIIFLATIVGLKLNGIELPPAPDVPFVTYFGLVGSMVNFAASFVVPGLVIGGRRRGLAQQGAWTSPATEGKWGGPGMGTLNSDLCNLFQTQLIIKFALLEGAIFFLLVAYMVENILAALAVAIILWLAEIIQFPTRSTIEAWLEKQRGAIEELRQTGGNS